MFWGNCEWRLAWIPHRSPYVCFVPFYDFHQVLNILASEIFDPVYAILDNRVNSVTRIRTRPGSLLERISDLQVLEQNTASEAGFLLRKTVFRHAYPTLGLAMILKKRVSYPVDLCTRLFASPHWECHIQVQVSIVFSFLFLSQILRNRLQLHLLSSFSKLMKLSFRHHSWNW